MSSPIDPLVKHILSAPFSAAPEKSEEFKELINRHNIKLHLSTSDEFTFQITGLTGLMIGASTLERIWAYLYGYLYITYIYQDAPGGLVIDLTTNKDRQEASTLLSWATSADIAKQYTPWPQNAPTPSSNPQNINIKATNELFFMATGWMILHEIAHIELKQTRPLSETAAIQQELDADNWASEWIMSETSKDDDEPAELFIKKTLGITYAISITSVFDLHKQRYSETHPNIIDRYLNFLSKYVPEEDPQKAHHKELAWLAAIATLGTHTSNSFHPFDLKKNYLNFTEHLLDIKQNLILQ